tara:strand:- start:475 stop:810 length:336 start_codon:yes stop_codon:yes gene_type:complete
MDHYGDMPPPSREEAIEHTIQRIKQLNNFTLISDEKIIYFCNESYNEINGLGSMAGWMVFTSREMYEKAVKKIKDFEAILQLEESTQLPKDITRRIIPGILSLPLPPYYGK